MAHGFAIFVTYGAHLVDGNLVTDLLSIGGKTSKTGPDPPAPAIVGGLNTHAVFEGRFRLHRHELDSFLIQPYRRYQHDSCRLLLR